MPIMLYDSLKRVQRWTTNILQYAEVTCTVTNILRTIRSHCLSSLTLSTHTVEELQYLLGMLDPLTIFQLVNWLSCYLISARFQYKLCLF
jgi:hypothetical protein